MSGILTIGSGSPLALALQGTLLMAGAAVGLYAVHCSDKNSKRDNLEALASRAPVKEEYVAAPAKDLAECNSATYEDSAKLILRDVDEAVPGFDMYILKYTEGTNTSSQVFLHVESQKTHDEIYQSMHDVARRVDISRISTVPQSLIDKAHAYVDAKNDFKYGVDLLNHERAKAELQEVAK